jgi:FkbH-like protein
MGAWSAPRYWEQAKAPCHPDAATVVGVETAIVISRLFRPAVRAVVVDLDDTLWGGIVGEAGPEGLDLDPDGTGRAYLELQRLLLDLSARGIPIGVVSKNDESQARRPFVERPEMLLNLESFVRFDASWHPKFEAIGRFASQLNVGIDSVCFLDDSAKERDEARRMLPGLLVPELADAPSKRVEQLLRSRLFTAPVVSEEDRLRVDFFKRAQGPAPADLDEYLGGLDMHLAAVSIAQGNAERALSLLHKTNQFNLTLWRPAPTELDVLVVNPRSYAYTFRLRDRLGDAGIIAVLLASRHGSTARVEGWVMSCRVFGRGVEWAIADHFARWIHDTGVTRVEMPHAHGPRNSMVVEVLLSLGLLPEEPDDAVTAFSAVRLVPPHHHITVEDQ